MDNDLNATFEACNNFNKKLKDTIKVEAIMKILKTSQELRMLSRSLSDCKSLLLNVMIQVSQFIRNGQLCH